MTTGTTPSSGVTKGSMFSAPSTHCSHITGCSGAVDCHPVSTSILGAVSCTAASSSTTDCCGSENSPAEGCIALDDDNCDDSDSLDRSVQYMGTSMADTAISVVEDVASGSSSRQCSILSYPEALAGSGDPGGDRLLSPANVDSDFLQTGCALTEGKLSDESVYFTILR